MSFPKLLILIALVLFGTIGIAAIFKKSKGKAPSQQVTVVKPAAPKAAVEVEFEREEPVVSLAPVAQKASEPVIIARELPKSPQKPLPEANRIDEFFNRNDPKLPIVETLTYKSRVDWQKGRPAWLSDYASHYGTSRHFIARSLNGKADYFKQDIAEGDRFNVLRTDKNFNFHLVIDTTRCKMWFYYRDLDAKEWVLIKTYDVGLGREDRAKLSGLLTPLGTYSLGDKIAIYKPKMTGYYNGEKTEMIKIFGSRWIPFEKEISNCSAPAKGFGIHGVPWVTNDKNELKEERSSLGKYESDGCVRLATEDIEEIFAIVITKPTTIELVKDFHDSKVNKE